MGPTDKVGKRAGEFIGAREFLFWKKIYIYLTSPSILCTGSQYYRFSIVACSSTITASRYQVPAFREERLAASFLSLFSNPSPHSFFFFFTFARGEPEPRIKFPPLAAIPPYLSLYRRERRGNPSIKLQRKKLRVRDAAMDSEGSRVVGELLSSPPWFLTF